MKVYDAIIKYQYRQRLLLAVRSRDLESSYEELRKMLKEKNRIMGLFL